MCDIYMAKCKKCKKQIDMHLADFDTDRDEVEVFCKRHIPKDKKDGVTWKYRDSAKDKWMVAFVRHLTENAKRNTDGNHPNSCELESDEWSRSTKQVSTECTSRKVKT